MSESYIVIRIDYGRTVSHGYSYICRRELRRFNRTKREWGTTNNIRDAFKFQTLKMALHRANTLSAVRYATRWTGSWEIVRITEPEVLAASGDSPLHQLARAAL